MKEIYYAHFQLTKVRAFMLFSLISAVGSVWLGIHLVQTYGIRPPDGGVLAPLPVRLAWGLGVALLGISFATAMWVYGKCYVARIELDEKAGRFYIYTVRFFGSRKHEIDAASVLSSHSNIGEMSDVSATWQSVRLKGRKLPLIIDEQGVVLDQKLMDRLFYGSIA